MVRVDRIRKVLQFAIVSFVGFAIFWISSTVFTPNTTAQEFLPPETLQLKIVNDEPSRGEAVLSGLVRLLGELEPRTLTARGENWLFEATVAAKLIADAPNYSFQGRSRSLPPMTGDAETETPEPFLTTPTQVIDDATILNPQLASGNQREQVTKMNQSCDRVSEKLTSILVDLSPNSPSFGAPTGIDGDFGRSMAAVLIGDRIENPCD
ncbi:MAG: hypothetical protein SW833_15135 [Cyanobacteriota bacterium]|nr:hypothetical protein [Cyanobacteriota bacterium]